MADFTHGAVPINKFEPPAPYIGLTMLLSVAATTVVYVRKREIQRLTLKQTIKEPVKCVEWQKTNGGLDFPMIKSSEKKKRNVYAHYGLGSTCKKLCLQI